MGSYFLPPANYFFKDIYASGNVTANLFIGNGSLLTDVTATATIPDIVSGDIRGNIIGNYANMYNVIGVIGNIGNTQFTGGNVSVSGQINVLGNVVASFYRGNGSLLEGITATLPANGNSDITGNIIGNYANMHNIVGITGNIGNTRFAGGNVSVSGQVNVNGQVVALGNIWAPFFRGNGSLLEGIATTLSSVVSADIRGNIIGNYANMHNIVGDIGNIGNTRFAGGNIAVSGQINVLGNVVAPFHIGEHRGNLIGDYANVITGNVGNTRFVGGNIAVSGQINVLGNVVAPFLVGDIRGNLIGDYANVITGNIGNTRFVGGNVAVSGQINVLGNVWASFFRGNGSLLEGITATATIPSVISADINGNIIGNYANMHNIVGVIGNIGNTRLVGGNVAVSGQVNVLGNVVAKNFIGNGAFLEGLPSRYLSAIRSTNQTVSGPWANGNVIMDSVRESAGITYNSSTGIFTLEGGVTYRITAQLNWDSIAPYTFTYRLVNNTTGAQIGQAAESSSMAITSNNTSGPILDTILTPSTTADYRLRIGTDVTAAGGEQLRANAGTFLTIVGLGSGFTTGLPTTGNIDMSGNIIGNYANMHNVVGVIGNIGNTRFSGGNVSVSGQVNVNGQIVALGNVWAPFFRGNGSLLEGIATTLSSVVSADIRGNIIGNYANMHNIVGDIGNIGNTRFVGGNIAVSGQINTLGNVVTPFLIGDHRGNIIGDYANVITGNIGNTRFVGGNIAVSGQINVLGNVIASFYRGNGSLLEGITATATIPSVISADINGNIIGNYANMHNIVGVIGNIGNTRLVGGNVAVSGQVNVLGNVVAKNFIGNGAFLEGLPSRYLSAIRSTNQKITSGFWGNLNIIMDSVRESAGITYDSTTGIITLEGGVTYRITAQLAFSGTTAYNSYAFRLVNSSTGVQIGQAGDPIGANASTGNTPASVLDLILTPSTTTSYRLRMADGLFVGTGEELRADAGTFLTIVGLGSGFTTGLPTTGNIDMSGNIIGNYANMHNVIGVIGNIGNTRFSGGNVSVSGQVNVSGQIVALGNVWASFFRGNGSLLEGITATLPSTGNSDINGNIIGNYANMHNVVGVIGNIGNTRFAGGNIAVSGQINVLGNVVAPFHIGDIRGNLIGDYANVITGNIGNTRFIGGNVAVSGQINTLGNVVAPFHIGDIRGNIIGDYANVITGNIGNTRFVGGNVAVSGQINVLGNIVAPFHIGDIRGNIVGDVRGNIIGDYANVITGNIGNIRFVGGNVAVSGQINVLGNIVALNFIGDNRGNIIGSFANVVTGNIGNTRFVGGNVAVSGQINVLGNVITPYFLGNIIGEFGNIGNVRMDADIVTARAHKIIDDFYITTLTNSTPVIYFDVDDSMYYERTTNTYNFLTGGVVRTTIDNRGNLTASGNIIGKDGIFTGNVNASGNVTAADGIFSGNVVATRDIIGSNTISITCAANANILTVTGSTTNSGGASVIQAVSLRGNASTYSMLRLDNIGGRLLDVTGNGEMSITSPTVGSDMLNITGRTSGFVGNAINIVVPKLSLTDYSFINCRNTNGPLFNIDGRGMVSVTTFVNSNNVVLFANSSSGYVSDVLRIQTTFAGASGWNVIAARNSGGNVFRVNGVGGVFGVGAYNTSGADYAEMFEWEDGNKLGEDRRGTTVIIGNNGAIRIASLMDNPIDVIGVVSVNPSVLGDTKWNEWSGRYLRDKFGAKLSNTLYYISNVSNETERVRCGINDTPPDGYEKIISSEHIENPNYDPNINYTSRENRPEWSPIGLVGKLRVLPGQIVNPGWKLLKTHKHVDGDTLEYLVK